MDPSGKIVGVLDVDSEEPAAFDEVDAEYLGKIVQLVYSMPDLR
jgi:putative methionine-R-sulfoxide reductase with GAF domain